MSLTQMMPSPAPACAPGVDPPSPEKRFIRRLVPSLTDCFFIALLTWLFSAGMGWQGLLQDGDTGWHIRTGEYVLDHGSPPTRDLFSFSKQNAEWYAWEWLTDVLYALIFRSLGLKGIVFASGVLICATGTLLLRHMIWRGVNGLLSVGLALLAVGACSVHYHARPHLFTLFFLALSLWMIDADASFRRRTIWLLVPLTVLWTNMHGGFLVLIACLGLRTAGALVASFTQPVRDWWTPSRYALLTGACAAASLINPYGIELHRHIYAYLQSDWIRNTIQEFQSPSFRSESMLQFEFFLLAGLASSGFLLARRRWAEAFTVLYFAHASLSAARHVPLFVIVSAPLIGSELTTWWNRLIAGSPRRSAQYILTEMAVDFGGRCKRVSVWSAVALLPLFFVGDARKWPTDFSARFPSAMVDKHRETLMRGRVLTSDQWADYLIFRSYPEQKVFVDGRSDFYGEALGNQYLTMMNAGHNWAELLRTHQFDVVLAPVAWPLTSALKMSAGWRVRDDDGKAVLFVRESAPAIARILGRGALMKQTLAAESTRREHDR